MIKLSLAEISTLLNCAKITHAGFIHGISKDTRYITPGNLYIAIKGEQFDGHDFIAEAAKKGASAALVSYSVDVDIPQIIVKNTVEALGLLSAHWRNRFSLPLIGVTGSNGKTTLKNMIASILTAACDNNTDCVLSTEGNLNNNIGLPLMLSRLNAKHQFGVLEMGMNHFNEIAYLTHLTKPLVAVINNAAESHLEGVKSIAGVAKAKGEIFQGLPAEGIAILNRDDAHFDYWKQLVKTQRILTFGMTQIADVYAEASTEMPTEKEKVSVNESKTETKAFSGTQISANETELSAKTSVDKDEISTQEVALETFNRINIHTPQGNISLALPLLGTHNIMNALAATAATLAINIPLSIIKQGLEKVTPAPGRMRQYTLPNQINIIDDTYNANPFSLRAAAKTLASFPNTKIVVLGDMKELGPDAKQLHFDAGIMLKELGIHHLFTYGELSTETQRAFGENAHHFTNQNELIHSLKSYLKNNITLLIKGSRSMKMEKIVESFIPEKKLEHTH